MPPSTYSNPVNCSAIETESINTLRMLAMDQVFTAKSGHYGFPLGASAIVHTLFARHLRFDPSDPGWANRDRFVLSAGHGSAMLYGQLHLAGYDLSIQDLQSFRQWGSRTAGHPERGHTPGVELTTGPLGQGIANAVGLAVAERHLREVLPAGAIDHRVWVLASDGDFMEGISFEAASLAGAWKLDRLTVIYDDNDVVIDSRAHQVVDPGAICQAWAAAGWRLIEVEQGMDVAALDAAFTAAADEDPRPTLIRVKTRIGAGSPKEDEPVSHSGAPSAAELAATRATLGLAGLAPFDVSPAVRDYWAGIVAERSEQHRAWTAQVEPETARELAGGWPGWDEVIADLDALPREDAPQATRKSSGQVLARLSERARFLIGGSADLAEATGAQLTASGAFSAQTPAERNLRFGVREHAMGAIVNGLAAHSVLRPFGSTFLAFATYQLNAIRMAALQQLPSLFVFSHDSILLGEDGPTHQPIEVLPALRAIPHLRVLRPADLTETVAAWQQILADPRPTCLILSRSDLPQLDHSAQQGGPADGAYVLRSAAEPAAVLFASGSEVHLATGAAELSGIPVTVVSVPDLAALEGWSEDTWQQVAPAELPRVIVEAANPMSWFGVFRPGDRVVAVTEFGASAPADVIAEHYGLTAAHVARELSAAVAAG